MTINLDEARIGVVGLGYVGLPLAVAFSRKFDVVGYDVNKVRIDELASGHDRTLEIAGDELARAERLRFTVDPDDLAVANIYIVTAPTPIDEHKNPDLSALRAATRSIARTLRPGDVVIYESTVYPGATEEECVPLLAEVSGLEYNKDFFVGYSPERINPGDKLHRFENIVKVTSGSTPEIAELVDSLYAAVVAAGTYRAVSIKVAEAAKVIENIQRDVNIALINELALLFNRLGIDTHDVLAAAGTKWNFLAFRPGLVGGHCIGVDPYYLTHKAREVNYHPEVILAGRRINDSMGSYVAAQLVMAMLRKGIDVREARVLILGLAFKEDTPDLRNTRVIDIYRDLAAAGLHVDLFDPWVDPDEAAHEYHVDLVTTPEPGAYDGLVLAVPHEQFRALGADGIHAFGSPSGHVLFDLKALLPHDASDLRL